MKSITISVDQALSGELFYDKSSKTYGYNYLKESEPISLTMPYRKSTYEWRYHLHPIFDMHIPEGYLFELFKNYLSKEYGYMDDFLLFSYLCPNIEGRVTFESEFKEKFYDGIDIDEILNNDSEDTFLKLLKTFFDKNAISGVQPKTLALIKDKESLSLDEYIVKAWGDEFPYLAENEYFCLKAVKRVGVRIPDIKISKNKKFLLVKKFTYDKKTQKHRGFEEILSLQGKNRDQKYSGSYEQVAKIIYSVSTDKEYSMEQFYKTVIMNYLLKNGDAHLKNFAILYDDLNNINFAPAYDVVTTTAYIFKDKPALTMFGKKVWWGKKELIDFGIRSCFFSKTKAKKLYEECLEAVFHTKKELEAYMVENPSFKSIAKRMLDSWDLSTKGITHKEVGVEIIRDWD